MTNKIICLIIGYFFGSFLTAEIVTRRLTGRPCRELGTSGNPGMANVMAHLGFVPGIIVLAGDLGKTIAAMLLVHFAFDQSHLALYYTMLGLVLGHNIPFYQPRHGGKGVAVTCMAVFIINPFWGLISDAVGMLVVFATQYLCVGAIVIPAFFIIPTVIFYGKEAGLIAIALSLIMYWRHFPALSQIPKGTCEKTDVIGAFRKKFFKH
ncbi:MAG: glycerol-3-phosphate acyltransferase [Lachnospiraceae bacterium]|uniref:Glycerol-3-phosphate acyltransferase n=1 Tax=Candidatus Weimeria bifida TaxID=2599074 RepID=A0A6N7IZ88_9FIRM|nr:glycerol-3-phosphate acyltransferase [Candidatus Weimeria bifida]RRF96049.1 MAG: glycerol-3-phosphate acyltransferase [Lachnospiraceae bacterium]